MANKILSRGQITIVDLNDAKQVSMILQVKNPSQMYNPDTKVYVPNFSTDKNTVTPKVYVTGSGQKMCIRDRGKGEWHQLDRRPRGHHEPGQRHLRRAALSTGEREAAHKKFRARLLLRVMPRRGGQHLSGGGMSLCRICRATDLLAGI